MKITLEIGCKTVSIETDYEMHEEDKTWPEIAEELLFPALRCFGYIITEEWVAELGESHRAFVRPQKRKH